MGKALNAIFDYIKKCDMLLWLLIFIISGYGMALIHSVSLQTNANYDRTQLFAIAIGILGAIVISLMDYGGIASYWYLIAGFCLFLMVYTIIFAEAVEGAGGVNAKAWINIGGRTFQSSELVKIGFLVTYAKHLDVLKKNGLIDSPLHVVLLFFHATVPIMLCHSQNDDGAGMVFLAIFLAMSFSANIKLRYFAILFALILLFIPILWNFILEDYQKSRFIAMFNPDNVDIQSNEGFQQRQAMISIASGQFKGHGLFNGRRIASGIVAVQQSDLIFSVAGEELGFVGCMAIIVLLLLLMIKILHVASVSRDDMGKYICFGYFGLIAMQSVVNIGMCLSLLPVMGITLPFFSSGGSSAMCLYFGIGLVQGVYMRRKEGDGMRLDRGSPIRINYKKMKTVHIR